MKLVDRRDYLWLIAWCLVGLGLRFLSLTDKPIWSDEWATLVFSLGHGFQSIPLDQLISLDTLLAPAQVGPIGPAPAGATQVVQRLMDESTHPPLYFLLCHVWIRFWQAVGEPVGLGIARSLSAFLGALSIPLTYVVSRWVQQSRQVARATAALMAVSPFGVYLAQEARHYTLALLFCLVSLGCFLRAWNSLGPQQKPLQLPTVGLWISTNLLGLATHYFMGLLLLAQATALLLKILIPVRTQPVGTNRVRPAVSVTPAKHKGGFIPTKAITSIFVAMGLTILGALPWGIFLIQIPSDRLTAWVKQDLSATELFEPPLRLIASLGSMVALPLLEQVPLAVAIASSLLLLAVLIWLLPKLIQAWNPPSSPLSSLQTALTALLFSFLGWILLSTYGFQRDLTLGARYLFGLLPVVLLGLAIATTQARSFRPLLTVFLTLGIIGSLSVSQGFAYGKPDRSDLLYQQIQASYQQRYPDTASDPDTGSAEGIRPTASGPPLVIGGVYKTHEQLSEMMSLAYEWRRSPSPLPEPSFFLAQRDPETKLIPPQLQAQLAQHPHPYELWLLNFAANINFASAGCQLEPAERLKVPGYWARRYVCPATAPQP